MNSLSNETEKLQEVILIVEDDPLLLTATSGVLYMAGYECHGAATADAALKAAQRIPLDLIICDVRIEGESGLELCHELRREQGSADVPVMFFSDKQLPDIIHRTFDKVGAYHLRKPFDPYVLLKLVDKTLWMPHLTETKILQDAAPANHGLPAGVPLNNAAGVHLQDSAVR